MNYLSVAVLVGSLILLHEVGHLLVAKWCGIPIARFSVGFGRKLWSIQSGETEYRVAVFPFGGYVLPATTLDEFEELPLHHRVAFALGGPVANLAVAIGTVAMVYVFQFGLSLDMLLLRPLGQVSQLVVQLLSVLPVLFTQPDHLAGIVGVVALGGDYVGTDFLRLLELSVLLNVNLAVFNLLPFLPLDGDGSSWRWVSTSMPHYDVATSRSR